MNIEQNRYFLKDSIRKTIDYSRTDQSLKVDPPPVVKPFDETAPRINLPPPGEWGDTGRADFLETVRKRRSRRKYSNSPFSMGEIAYLAWTTQGVQKMAGNVATLRPVPSAGARHAFETYIVVNRVEGLEKGIYRYLPVEHQLILEEKNPRAPVGIAEACFGQKFIGTAAAVFVWTTIPYRMEWRYGLASHKMIALDAGHVCQNLYLACEAIGAGACGIAAYDQEEVDALLGVDGDEEFTIYLAPAGKL